MFRIEIETNNAAFGESDETRKAEVARILSEIVERLAVGYAEGPCHDALGNRVGSFGFNVGGRRVAHR